MRIALCTQQLGKVSETFIQTHAEGLRPGLIAIEQGNYGLPVIDGRFVCSQAHVLRAARKARRMLLGKPWSDEIDYAYAAAFRQADVVLAEYGQMGVRVLPACRKTKTPLVVHFHGHDASQHDVLDLHRDDYLRMFDFASAVVAVSRRMRCDLLALGCPEEKLVLNPYGIDTETFRATTPADNPPTLLAVGRLVEKKAPHLLLLAFERVLRQAPDARLRVIGDGPLRGVCDDILEATGIGSVVELLGPQPHQQVAAEMAAARAFVQHSVTAPNGDAEGTPVAVLEASASGLPVVATRHAGIADAVVDSETGYLIDEYDVDGMADRMLRVIAEPEKAQRLGQSGRERMIACYERRSRLTRLRTVLEAAATGHKIPYIDDDALSGNRPSEPTANGERTENGSLIGSSTLQANA